MAKTIGDLLVKLGLDGTGFQNGISKVNRQMRLAQSEFQKANAKLGDFGRGTDGLRLKADSLTKRLGLQRERVSALQGAYRAVAQAKGQDAKETQNLGIKLNRAQADMYKMQNELKGLNRELRVKGSTWYQVGQRMENTGDKMRTVGDHAANMGRTMSMYVTAPIVAAGGASVKFAVDFESAFAGVRKTVDATEKEFASMKQEIRDMAKTMPATTEEISRVAEAAGQLGIKKENLMSFTKTMVKLGTATNMSSDEAATALARLANITQMPEKNFDRLGATVVHLGNNLAATESEIVEMGLRIAGAGHQVGMTENQILSFAGALSSVGIRAEAGGTAISRVMLQMNTDVAEGGEKLKLFAQVAGMSADEFKKSFEKDAAGAILSFIEGLGRMKKDGENVVPVLKDLGLNEIRVRDALLRASGAGDLFRRTLDLGSKAWKENTALNKEAAERYKTTASQMKILWNRIKDVGITLGDALIPVLLNALKTMQPLIDGVAKLAKWFSTLNPTIQTIGVAFVGLIAAMGPVLMIVGDFIAAIGGMISILGMASTAMAGAGGASAVLGGALSVLTGPVGWVTGLIVGLIAAGTALYLNWDKLNEKYSTLMKVLSFTNPLFMVVSMIKKVQSAFSDAVPEVDRFGNKVSASTKKALGSYFKLEDEASASLKRLYWSGDKVTQDTADKVAENFSAMGDKIVKQLDKKQQEAQEILGSWFKAENVLPDKREQEIMTKLNGHYDKQRQEIEQGEKRVKAIMETASKEKRAISEKEYKEIEGYMHNFRSAAVENLTKSENEQKIIWERMRNQNTAISARESADIVKESNKRTDKVIKDAEKVRDEKVDWARKARDELGIISAEEADKLIESANKEHDQTVEKAKSRREKVIEQAKAQSKDHVNEVDWETGELLSKWQVFFNNLWDILVEWWNGEIQDFIDLWETVKAKWDAGLAWLDTFLANMGEKWEQMKTDASTKWDQLTEKIKEKAKEIASSPMEKFEELCGKASTKWDQLKSEAANKWNSMKTKVINIADDIRKKPGEKFNQLKNDAIKKFENLRGKASSKWESIKKTITNKAENMRTSVRDKMEGVKKAVVDKWNKAESFLKKINLRSIGRDIINGLKDGIASKAQSLYDKAESIANRVKRTLKSALGINSPSRVTREIGEFVGEGLEIGMGSKVNAIRRRAEQLASAAIVTPTPATMGGGGALAVGSLGRSSVASSDPIININFNGPVHVRNDDDIKRLSKQISRDMIREQARTQRSPKGGGKWR